jgi:hypothetical protein
MNTENAYATTADPTERRRLQVAAVSEHADLAERVVSELVAPAHVDEARQVARIGILLGLEAWRASGGGEEPFAALVEAHMRREIARWLGSARWTWQDESGSLSDDEVKRRLAAFLQTLPDDERRLLLCDRRERVGGRYLRLVDAVRSSKPVKPS